jgi:hypothetical protein
MKTLRWIIAVISFISISGALYIADFQNLISRQNLVSLLLILVSILNLVPMVIYFRQESKKHKDNQAITE